ncbi:alginate export family protein [Melioribacter sp. OK-6-Me]|uniref:alginate export family protein n=1 Tax=unclassified Melioribacter TaxID=2627329 RepID=UPI003ED91F1D
MKKILSLLLALPIILNAQSIYKLDFQLRPRFEIDNKDFNSSTNPNTFTALRTRLGLKFNVSKDMSAYIQLQDSRIFGEEISTLSNSNNLDLHQAYFKINNFFDLPVDIKVGRMELKYGSERFLGPVDWHNVGRSFDGGVLTFKSSLLNADLIAVREFEKFNVGDSLDQNIYALMTDLFLFESYKIQPFVIWQRVNPTNYLDRATLGFYIAGNLKNFQHEIDFGFQTGSALVNGREQDLNAMTFSINTNYNFSHSLKPSLGFQLDYASGDDNPLDNEYKAYTSVYPTGHKFFGFMDYFVNLNNDTYNLGILDIAVKCSIQPIRALSIAFNYHIFRSVEDYVYSGGTSNEFGSEADLTFNYKYNEYVDFQAGASLFNPSKIFERLRGNDLSSWYYLMATVNL